jgi:hypothetical protein
MFTKQSYGPDDPAPPLNMDVGGGRQAGVGRISADWKSHVTRIRGRSLCFYHASIHTYANRITQGPKYTCVHTQRVRWRFATRDGSG